MQALIGLGRIEFVDLGLHHVFGNERILVHAGLQVRQRNIVRQNPATQVGLETAGQQENPVIESPFDPCLVGIHELAGPAPVDGEWQNDLHDTEVHSERHGGFGKATSQCSQAQGVGNPSKNLSK